MSNNHLCVLPLVASDRVFLGYYETFVRWLWWQPMGCQLDTAFKYFFPFICSHSIFNLLSFSSKWLLVIHCLLMTLVLTFIHFTLTMALWGGGIREEIEMQKLHSFTYSTFKKPCYVRQLLSWKRWTFSLESLQLWTETSILTDN